MPKAPGKILKILAQNLKRLRGTTPQIQFAKKLGIAQSSLNRMEQGIQNVTLTTVEQLSSALKCKVTDLLL